MNLNKHFLLILLIIILNIYSIHLEELPYGTKEVFESCKFQGKESIGNGNVNCTRLPVPELWDLESNEKCIREFVKGCQHAKIEQFCHQGANDLLTNKNNKCEQLKQLYEFGMDFYPLCCNVCLSGKNTYLRKEPCKKDPPFNATTPELIVHGEFENCCSNKATKGLRSIGDYEEDSLIDDNIDICENYGCEHFCYQLDYNLAKCSCRKGYQLNNDGKKCDDINECLTINECIPNQQQCINLNGTYDCKDIELNSTENNQINNRKILNLRNLNSQDENQCKNGYFDPHRNMCIDIGDQYENFCLDEKCNTNTEQLIDKNNSSSKCSEGYELNQDSRFCEDIDECSKASNTCAANQICINRLGRFDCLEQGEEIVCERGLVLNNKQCIDIDECQEKKCDNNQECVNLLGDYKCLSNEKAGVSNDKLLEARDSNNQSNVETDCGSGQKLVNGTCIEIDACAEKPDLCGPNSTCLNSFGKAICKCKQGYTKNETTGQCEDKDECVTHENECIQSVSTCKNLEGSYECICKEGFAKKDGSENCENINECEDNSHGCHHKCLDSHGSYECECYDGYILDKNDPKKCKELDYCETENFCDGECLKKNSTHYECKKCNEGFEFSEDKTKCVSIDICKKITCGNDEKCVNLKNGDSKCVNLNCPKNYEENERVCSQKPEMLTQNNEPISLTKNVLVLSLKYVNTNLEKTVYRFKHLETDEKELNDFKFEIKVTNNSNNDNLLVDDSYFKLVKQEFTHNLLIVKPIKKDQEFTIDMNVVYKNRILYQSKIFVFIAK